MIYHIEVKNDSPVIAANILGRLRRLKTTNRAYIAFLSHGEGRYKYHSLAVIVDTTKTFNSLVAYFRDVPASVYGWDRIATCRCNSDVHSATPKVEVI